MFRKKHLWVGLLVLGLFVSGGLWLDRRYEIPVIMYHKVEPSFAPQADTVTPEVFRSQIRFLYDRGFQVIPLSSLVALLQARQPLPRKTVVLTFDDGYENNYLHAFPILKFYGFPATVFASPGFTALSGYLHWPQILAMQDGGITFGSHGMEQVYLPTASEEVQVREIFESKRLLEEKLGRPVEFYAYPVGGFNHRVKEFLRAAGYAAAVTTNRGYDKGRADLYEIRRIRLDDSDRSPYVLWLKTCGYYNALRNLKDPG